MKGDPRVIEFLNKILGSFNNLRCLSGFSYGFNKQRNIIRYHKMSFAYQIPKCMSSYIVVYYILI